MAAVVNLGAAFVGHVASFAVVFRTPMLLFVTERGLRLATEKKRWVLKGYDSQNHHFFRRQNSQLETSLSFNMTHLARLQTTKTPFRNGGYL